MLSATEITAMRETLTDSLPGTVTISRATYSADGMGGQVEAWAAIGTVAGRVSPAGTGSEVIQGGGVAAVSPWVATLPAGTNVTERDRLAHAGRTLEVTALDTPRDWDTCIRCACEEVG